MNLKNKKVNYFDFGLYEATEMNWIIKAFDELGITDYSVYGFEAYPPYFENVKNMFNGNDKVRIMNLAVSDEYSKIKLHLSKKGPEGHSIISTKINLSENFVMVDTVDISDWIKNNVSDFEDSINIVRMNVEGAEINIFNSFIHSGINKKIQIFSGSLADIHKIGISEEEKIKFIRKLKSNDIDVLYLCKDKPESIEAIKNKLQNVYQRQ